jgi:ABC-2 type transport system permease protein
MRKGILSLTAKEAISPLQVSRRGRITLTGLPAAISQEKEVGTLDGMMVAPINRLSIIVGKTLAQTARGLLQGVLILILASVLFGVSIQGNILLVFGLLLLGVFSFVGLGVVLTSFAKDQETAMMIMMTLMFPMMFLGGVFFSVDEMPQPLPYVARALPLTYATEGLRAIQTWSIPIVLVDATVLLAYTIITILVGSKILMRLMTRSSLSMSIRRLWMRISHLSHV